MPPRVDTWFFSVHNFIKRHNLRHWLTVAEARKLLKGEKIGIDAAIDRLFGGGMLAAVEDDVDGDASRAREAIEKRFAWISKLGPR